MIFFPMTITNEFLLGYAAARKWIIGGIAAGAVKQ